MHTYVRKYVDPCPTSIKFSTLHLARKAKRTMKADKKHDEKVAMLKLCTYVYNLLTYNHFHLPQVTDKQLPQQYSSQPNSSFVFRGTGRISTI